MGSAKSAPQHENVKSTYSTSVAQLLLDAIREHGLPGLTKEMTKLTRHDVDMAIGTLWQDGFSLSARIEVLSELISGADPKGRTYEQLKPLDDENDGDNEYDNDDLDDLLARLWAEDLSLETRRDVVGSLVCSYHFESATNPEIISKRRTKISAHRRMIADRISSMTPRSEGKLRDQSPPGGSDQDPELQSTLLSFYQQDMVEYTTLPTEASSLDEDTLTLLKLTQNKAKTEKQEFLAKISPRQLDVIARNLWTGGISDAVRNYIVARPAQFAHAKSADNKKLSKDDVKSEEHENLTNDAFGRTWSQDVSRAHRVYILQLLAMCYIKAETENPDEFKRRIEKRATDQMNPAEEQVEETSGDLGPFEAISLNERDLELDEEDYVEMFGTDTESAPMGFLR
ncbi:hypothetical protein K491DRAFT_723068 [Lophiostoma macrostomum CBS 122681]|uniref:Uncharacterized protein n=1 Tax=Lophiostoma macrostomum CBS 122681 TaxID=1314788 RepID=A0A6A6SLN1_9PLEO|nr:hypothetical protein K491DRAFT_723068 [Lophiostoma macrostomum CBS 122681]